jgi:hypothetical protein
MSSVTIGRVVEHDQAMPLKVVGGAQFRGAGEVLHEQLIYGDAGTAELELTGHVEHEAYTREPLDQVRDIEKIDNGVLAIILGAGYAIGSARHDALEGTAAAVLLWALLAWPPSRAVIAWAIRQASGD